MNPLLTPKQVAEILGISTWTVNQLCNRKKLRFIKVDSKNRRFSEEMIQEYVDSQTIQSEEPVEHKPNTRKTSSSQSSKHHSIEELREEVATWL